MQKAQSILDAMGIKGTAIEREGASDSRHFAPLGIPCIDFGPKGGNMHGRDEYVEINSLEKLYLFYTSIAEALLK